MDEARLREILERFEDVTIACVGDLFLDLYLEIDPSRAEISRETGIPTWPVLRHWSSPGAAGTVMKNLRSLGAGRIVPVAIIGEDFGGSLLADHLRAARIDGEHLIRRPDRSTQIYTKLVERRGDAWVEERPRLDFVNADPIPPEVEEEVLAHLGPAVDDAGAVAVLDQVEREGHGIVTPRIRAALEERARARPGTPFLADSRAHIGSFRGMVVKVNELEAVRAADPEADAAERPDRPAIARAGASLTLRTGRPAIVTIGAEGALVFDGTSPPEAIPGLPVGVVDIVGAGDSFSAAAILALAAGASISEAARIGNTAASVAVGKPGTGSVSREEILARHAHSPR
ncbi:MAG: ribokinase [Planctomycetes bacterium]|nr:ribokinase [Planctomycetota bacterium]